MKNIYEEEKFFDNLENRGYFLKNIPDEERFTIFITTMYEELIRIITKYNKITTRKNIINVQKNFDSLDGLISLFDQISTMDDFIIIKHNINKLIENCTLLITALQGARLTTTRKDKSQKIFKREINNNNQLTNITFSNNADGHIKVLKVIYNTMIHLSNEETLRKLEESGKTYEPILLNPEKVTRATIVSSYKTVLGENYARLQEKSLNTEVIEELIRKHVNTHYHSLVINPNSGDTAAYIRELGGFNIFACGIIPEYKEAIKSKITKLTINLTDKTILEHDYLENRFANVVFPNSGFSQLSSDKERLKYLKEIYKVLKTNGKLILTTTDLSLLAQVNPELTKNYLNFIKSESYKNYGLSTKEDCYTFAGYLINFNMPQKNERLFAEANLQIEEVYDFKDEPTNTTLDAFNTGKAYVLTKK